jgi:hypothetical protein
MFPYPHLTHPTYPARKKACFLILTQTEEQPKPKNQQAPQPKHEVRNPQRPHPHKENKKRLTLNRKIEDDSAWILISNECINAFMIQEVQ